MSIADKLTRLQNAKTAIATAITNNGGSVASGDGFESFATDINSILLDRTVTFMNGSDRFQKVSVPTGHSIAKPTTDPTSSSGVFIGWTEAAGISLCVSFPYTPLANMNLYARYSSLPSSYQLVEYLQASGEQYINTGLTSYKSTYIYNLAVKRSGTGTRFVFAQNPDYSIDTIGLFNTSTGYYVQVGKGNQRCALTTDTATFYNISIESDGYTLNGTKHTVTPVSEFTVNNNLYLFAGTSPTTGAIDSRMSIDAISGFQVIDSTGTHLCDLLPCYRKSDSKPGMYDLVTETFLTNANTSATTDFTVGPDVN